jgi:hypothetical protein
LALIAVVAIVVLCWLFLAYSHPEYIASVIPAIVGFFGGFGAGRASVKSTDTQKDSTGDSST